MDSVIPGTAAITAIRILPTRIRLRITTPIIQIRITPIPIPTGRLPNNSSMALRNTVLRNTAPRSMALRSMGLRNSNHTLLRRTLGRNNSNTPKALLLRRRSKPRPNRTRRRATLRRLRNPAATTARMASGIDLARSVPNKTADRLRITLNTLHV